MRSPSVFRKTVLMYIVIIAVLSTSRQLSAFSEREFNKVPLQGLSLEVYETTTTGSNNDGRSRSVVACAVECLRTRSSTPVCQAFRFESTDGSCTLYKTNDDGRAVALSNLQVYLYQVTDRFYSVGVGLETFVVYVSSSRKTFFEARANCKATGGFLLEFDSLSQYTAVDRILAGHSGVSFYVGAHDMAEEGVWVKDRDNETMDPNLLLWNPGWPDNYDNGEHCAVFDRPTGRLGDVFCGSKCYYLCQKDV